MNLRRLSLAALPVCAIAAAALLWRPADAQPRLPPGVINIPPASPYTYNKATYQYLQSDCQVREVQYWVGTVTADIWCTALNNGTPGQTPGTGEAWVTLTDQASTSIALTLYATKQSTQWTAEHNAGEDHFHIKGIGY